MPTIKSAITTSPTFPIVFSSSGRYATEQLHVSEEICGPLPPISLLAFLRFGHLRTKDCLPKRSLVSWTLDLAETQDTFPWQREYPSQIVLQTFFSRNLPVFQTFLSPNVVQ